MILPAHDFWRHISGSPARVAGILRSELLGDSQVGDSDVTYDRVLLTYPWSPALDSQA